MKGMQVQHNCLALNSNHMTHSELPKEGILS